MLKNQYDFYRMPEEERKALVGKPFQTIDQPGGLYFPIQLTEEGSWNNYNRRQGLIYVSTVMTHWKLKTMWFRVAAASPDDLDMDLDFDETEINLREPVIDFLKEITQIEEVTYKEVLDAVQAQFNAGRRTS